MAIARGVVVLLSPAVVLLAPMALVWGQSQTSRQQFEVASVKPSKRATTEPSVRVTPGRLTVENMTLRRLIFVAYRVRDFQISSAAGWMISERFDIDAKTDASRGVDAMLLMLQDLIEDRFSLRSHRETKDGPVYRLKIAPGGSKMHASNCVPFDPNNLLKQSALSVEERTRQCIGIHRSSGALEGTGISIEDGTGPPFQSLTGQLSLVLDRPVLNETGLAGRFEIHLRWKPEPLAGDVAPGTATSIDDNAPSIFTAMEEQLGLKLEAGKGPVEYFVIDSARKPDEN